MMWLLLILLLVVSLFVYQMLRMKRKMDHLKSLADEAESSKQQIIIEQERNRQLKQEMTSNIAHELKTPVASIRGYLEILLGDKQVSPEQRKFFLERCYSQTLRLSDLIRDVSILNKLEEASDLYAKNPIDVYEVAEEAMGEMQQQASEHQISLVNHVPHVVINGDKSLLYSIFRNLIDNSIHHAGEGVEVCVECYQQDQEMLYLHYYDTGIGVGNEYLEKIFDRFQRIDSGRSRKNGGTGLGLSIVKHAVKFHGGTIYAKNRDQGGLEFYFSLKK